LAFDIDVAAAKARSFCPKGTSTNFDHASAASPGVHAGVGRGRPGAAGQARPARRGQQGAAG